MNSQQRPQPIQNPPVPGVENIIAIASGKGGVGKSTLAVNLALALQKLGKKTGILDADIYGPSQPWMLGMSGSPAHAEEKHIQPVISHGLASMSIGYLIEDKDTPMVWRGPMVSQALQQMMYSTAWPKLDYLIVDLPPGTGDIQLTLTQKIPMQGVIIITTPQEVALLDAKKALNMFKKMHIPILGIVENMSVHTCHACGHQEAIFGEAGGERLAALHGLPLFGKLPLLSQIRAHLDAGLPTLVAEPDGPISKQYVSIAAQLIVAVNKQTEARKEEMAAHKKSQKPLTNIDFKYEP